MQIRIILDKIKEIEQIQFDKDLEKILNIKASAISQRIRHNSIPTEEIIEWAKEREVDLNWLFNNEKNTNDKNDNKQITKEKNQIKNNELAKLIKATILLTSEEQLIEEIKKIIQKITK